MKVYLKDESLDCIHHEAINSDTHKQKDTEDLNSISSDKYTSTTVRTKVLTIERTQIKSFYILEPK